MAQSSARCGPSQSPPFDSKDKLAGGTVTKSSDRRTPASVATHTPTLAVALVGSACCFWLGQLLCD